MVCNYNELLFWWFCSKITRFSKLWAGLEVHRVNPARVHAGRDRPGGAEISISLPAVASDSRTQSAYSRAERGVETWSVLRLMFRKRRLWLSCPESLHLFCSCSVGNTGKKEKWTNWRLKPLWAQSFLEYFRFSHDRKDSAATNEPRAFPSAQSRQSSAGTSLSAARKTVT